MDDSKSRIIAQDAIVLFADLQTGIVELSQTNPVDRLKTGVRALAKLAKLLGIPAVVSGVRSADGKPSKMIPQIADGLGDLPTHHRTTCDSFLMKRSSRRSKRQVERRSSFPAWRLNWLCNFPH
jgi:hypothetical protein